MRESVTADDLAIDAAKQKLAELVTRAEYEDELRPRPVDNGPRRAAIITLVAFIAIGVVVWFLTTGVLCWILTIVFSVIAVMVGLAVIGFATEKPPVAVGAVVLDKRFDGKFHEVVLLCADGEQITSIVIETLYDMIKPGDLGVARLSHRSASPLLSELKRM